MADATLDRLPILQATGERRLMAALIKDAIEILDRRAGNIKNMPLIVETLHWLESEDDRWLFSFRRCCEVLGLEPDAVRRHIPIQHLWDEVYRKVDNMRTVWRRRRKEFLTI